jgi:hypothetical protein
VFRIPWWIVVGGECYGDFDGRKSLIIYKIAAEDCLRVPYGDGDGAAAHYEAEEPNKLNLKHEFT